MVDWISTVTKLEMSFTAQRSAKSRKTVERSLPARNSWLTICNSSARGVPLIIDNAYGLPFPNIVFTDVQPTWNENIIMCMSMSKLGLPGIRTGVVVASEEIIDALASMNSVLSLAVSSVGAVLLHDLVESGKILELCRHTIQPFYKAKVDRALDWVHESFAGIDYHVHRPEGALFLWLWFPGLPISSTRAGPPMLGTSTIRPSLLARSSRSRWGNEQQIRGRLRCLGAFFAVESDRSTISHACPEGVPR